MPASLADGFSFTFGMCEMASARRDVHKDAVNEVEGGLVRQAVAL